MMKNFIKVIAIASFWVSAASQVKANDNDSARWTYADQSSTQAERFDLLVAPKMQTSQVGQSISLRLAAVGAQGARFEAQNLPPGLYVDTVSGIVSGVVSDDAGGRYQVTIKAESAVRREQITFTWFVVANDVPRISSPGLILSSIGSVVDLNMAATFRGSSEGLTYAAWNLPPGLQIDNQGHIKGTVQAHDRLVSYQVTVQALYKMVAPGDTAHLPIWGGVTFTWVVTP